MKIDLRLPDIINLPLVSQYSGICEGIAIKPQEIARTRSRQSQQNLNPNPLVSPDLKP